MKKLLGMIVLGLSITTAQANTIPSCESLKSFLQYLNAQSKCESVDLSQKNECIKQWTKASVDAQIQQAKKENRCDPNPLYIKKSKDYEGIIADLQNENEMLKNKIEELGGN
jgi:hypothetical protein